MCIQILYVVSTIFTPINYFKFYYDIWTLAECRYDLGIKLQEF